MHDIAYALRKTKSYTASRILLRHSFEIIMGDADSQINKELLLQHRQNAAHAALLDGPATALWLMAKPAWSSTCSLCGALRFERHRWEEQVEELKQSGVPIVHATTPLVTNVPTEDSGNYKEQMISIRNRPPCSIEIVQLIEADTCDVIESEYGNGLVKYRIRRNHMVQGQDEDMTVARMTFAGAMSSLISDANVSQALLRLWETVSHMLKSNRKTMSSFLGYDSKIFDLEKCVTPQLNHMQKVASEKDSRKGWQVSPWQGDRLNEKNTSTALNSEGQHFLEERNFHVELKQRSSRGRMAAKAAIAALVDEKDNTPSTIHRDEFIAAYVCMWRILVGAHIHLGVLSQKRNSNLNGSNDQEKPQSGSSSDFNPIIQDSPRTTSRESKRIPGKRPNRDSGNWFGLHSEYRLHAKSAASVDFQIFARHPHQSISKECFYNCMIAMAELWIPRRSAEHAAAFLHTLNTSIIKFLKSPSHGISFRSFPGPLVFESSTMKNALKIVNNLGFPISFYNELPNKNRKKESQISNGADHDARGWREGVIGKNSGNSTGRLSRLRSNRRLSYYKQVDSSLQIPGRNGKTKRPPSPDQYLRHKGSKFSFGRRTPITVMDDPKERPGPGKYSPWSPYPFSDPFGAPRSTQGFSFEASSGRESTPLSDYRSKELARRRTVASTHSHVMPQELGYSKINKDVAQRRASRSAAATGGRGGKSISRSLYDAEKIRLQREYNKSWKQRINSAKQNKNRKTQAVRGRIHWGMPEPMSPSQYEDRESRMRAPGRRRSMNIPKRVSMDFFRNHPLVSPVTRRPQESMSTLCHPGRYSGRRGDASFVFGSGGINEWDESTSNFQDQPKEKPYLHNGSRIDHDPAVSAWKHDDFEEVMHEHLEPQASTSVPQQARQLQSAKKSEFCQGHIALAALRFFSDAYQVEF